MTYFQFPWLPGEIVLPPPSCCRTLYRTTGTGILRVPGERVGPRSGHPLIHKHWVAPPRLTVTDQGDLGASGGGGLTVVQFSMVVFHFHQSIIVGQVTVGLSQNKAVPVRKKHKIKITLVSL